MVVVIMVVVVGAIFAITFVLQVPELLNACSRKATLTVVLILLRRVD